jgi:hypothetical protein
MSALRGVFRGRAAQFGSTGGNRDVVRQRAAADRKKRAKNNHEAGTLDAAAGMVRRDWPSSCKGLGPQYLFPLGR